MAAQQTLLGPHDRLAADALLGRAPPPAQAAWMRRQQALLHETLEQAMARLPSPPALSLQVPAMRMPGVPALRMPGVPPAPDVVGATQAWLQRMSRRRG